MSEQELKCPKCGGEAVLVNDQTSKGYRIYQCLNWEKGTCDYGCFGRVNEDGGWKEMKLTGSSKR